MPSSGSRQGPEVVVYVIHWNAPDWCASAVASIAASKGVRSQVVVIDNGPHDGSSPLSLKLAPGTRILPQPCNNGYTGGANAALRDWQQSYPVTEFAVIASHDLHLEPTALRSLLAAMRADTSLGIVGPRFTEPPPARGRGVWDGRRARLILTEASDPVARVDWLTGACLLIRDACARQVGTFDEYLGSYVEDVDYCLRARDRGWIVAQVSEAQGRGLGAISSRAGCMIEANHLYLRYKRGGAVEAARAVWDLMADLAATVLNRALLQKPRRGSIQRLVCGLARGIPKVLFAPRRSGTPPV